MAKKPKQIVWHKKTGKMLSSSVLKPHGAAVKAGQGSAEDVDDRRKAFAKKLAEQIKKAVDKSVKCQVPQKY